MKKNNKYFSHDCNARNDEKMLAVRMRHGVEGYGIYFMLLERLRDEADYTGVKDYNVIAFDLRVSAEKIKSIVEDFGFFQFTEDGKRFYSESFLNRMAIKDLISQSKSESGKIGALKKWQNGSKKMANAIENDGKNMAIKVKESKVKESKEIISLSDFKIQQQNKFDNLDKSCLTYLNALGITKPLIYLTKFVNDPPMDFVEIVLDCYRDEEWRTRMKNLYGDGLNDAYSRFVKEKSISEYVKSAYRNKEEFQTHFQNYYNKQKR